MNKEVSDTVKNICTILGGALILYPLIDEATKKILPEMQKLTSDETAKELKLLAGKHEKEEELKDKETPDDEIAELKRKLAELESKADTQENVY